MKQSLSSNLRNRVASRRAHLDRCIASGWQLRRSCTDGQGRAVCPACTQPVRMRSTRPLRQLAWVVEDH